MDKPWTSKSTTDFRLRLCPVTVLANQIKRILTYYPGNSTLTLIYGKVGCPEQKLIEVHTAEIALSLRLLDTHRSSGFWDI